MNFYIAGIHLFAWIGAALAILAYIILGHGLSQSKMPQNILTWGLWAILDLVAFVSVLVQGGNSLLIAIFVLGSASITVLIYRTGGVITWTWFEKTILLLVALCMMIWYLSGPQGATIASTIAVCLAGVPQLKDIAKNPNETPLSLWVLCFFANGITTAGGKNWSIEERLYPAACAVYCLILVLLTLRRYTYKQA